MEEQGNLEVQEQWQNPEHLPCGCVLSEPRTTAFSPNLVHRIFLQYYTDMKGNFLLWIVLMRKMLAKDNRGARIKSNLCLSLIWSIRTSSTYLHLGAKSVCTTCPSRHFASHASVCSHWEHPQNRALLWLHSGTREGQHIVENSLAPFFPLSFGSCIVFF